MGEVDLGSTTDFTTQAVFSDDESSLAISTRRGVILHFEIDDER